jgi:hypothetical protein
MDFGKHKSCRVRRHVGLVGLIATWQGADPPHARSDLDRLVDEVLGLADVLQGYPPVPDVGSSYEGAYQNSTSPVPAARSVLAISHPSRFRYGTRN